MEEKCRQILEETRDLPLLHSSLIKLNEILNKRDTSFEDISKIIEKDPSFTAKILKLANSSYYGLSYKVDTIKKAISVLGLNTLRNIAVSVSLKNIFNNIKGKEDIENLWYHSLGCGVAAKRILAGKDIHNQEKAFTSGILHDIGKLIILQYSPDIMEKILSEFKKNKSLSDFAIEEKYLGFNHAIMGGVFTEKWRFPEEFVYAIKNHNYIKDDESNLIAIGVYVGNNLAKLLGLGQSSNIIIGKISPFIWNKLNFTMEDIPRLLSDIKKDFENIVKDWSL